MYIQVCRDMYIYIYNTMYTYIYIIYIYLFIYIYKLYLHVCIHLHACMPACIRTNMCTHMCVYIVDPRKLEHGFRRISARIPYTLPQGHEDNDVPTFWLLL